MGGPYSPPGPPPGWNQRRHRSVVWPAILIILGLVFLLQNFGLLGSDIWSYVGRLWPVILILVGLELIVGGSHRAAGGVVIALVVIAVAGALLIGGFAPSVVGAGSSATSTEAHTLTQALQGASTASVSVHFGAGTLNIGSLQGQTDQLAQMTYQGSAQLAPRASYRVRGGQGQLTYDVAHHFGPPWANNGGSGGQIDLLLAPTVPLSLDVEEGASSGKLDLSQLHVSDLTLQTGASHATLILPQNAGTTTATIKGGAATIDVEVPEGVAAQIHYNGGLSTVNVDESLFPSAGDQTFRSPNYDSAQNKVDLTIQAGVSTVHVSGVPASK
ncbi:MAG TPA: DUF5668 domain-containing protein [Chloroflexota bacterium]|nr:DUF5668 domain-containing protein [Chloroflexota bacterium]